MRSEIKRFNFFPPNFYSLFVVVDAAKLMGLPFEGEMVDEVGERFDKIVS